jgi:hypothetical protein
MINPLDRMENPVEFWSGFWTIEDPDYCIEDGDRNIIGEVYQRQPMNHYDPEKRGTPLPVDRNAELICAAPAMLRALRGLIQAPDSLEYQRALEDAQNIIHYLDHPDE